MIRKLRIMAVIAVAFIAAFFSSAPAMANYPTNPNVYYFGTDYCTDFTGNQTCVMYPGSGWLLYSSNNRDRLGFGLSGNFAGYDNGNSAQWFSSNTACDGCDTLEFQRDCNVVIYRQSDRKVLWAAGSQEGQTIRRCRLTMGGDGHFSIWDWDPFYNIWYRIVSWGNGAWYSIADEVWSSSSNPTKENTMATIITDADLDRTEVDILNKGAARAAGYLRSVVPELRATAYSAGVIFANTHPGYRMADGVSEIVRRIKAGWTEQDLDTYIRENR
jgi:hypothetical protein